MENPVFTTELDVSRGSSYCKFVSGVRDQLVLHAGATREQQELVLLRKQEDDPRKALWFGVTLWCGSGESVFLRIRADNLYISAYQSSEGRWWEFKGGSVVVDSSVTQLAFSDSYGDMEQVAKVELGEITLGKNKLDDAVRKLSATGGADAGGCQKETARSLMVITVMISEAIRFRSVAGFLGHIVLKGTDSFALPAHMVEQVKNWSSLSEYWLGAVRHSEPFLPRIVAEESQLHPYADIPKHLLAPLKIECQDHALMALGVVLNRLRRVQDRHKEELDAFWRAVRAQARKLDRARA